MATLAQRRRALQAADELLNDLAIDQEQPVDVFAIIDDLDLELVFNPLNSLLGAVVPSGSGGIMLTTQRGPSVQRYTAAHEIGHWILDIDQLAFDSEGDIFWPSVDRERLAQLFAGQLLMPPPLVYAMCRRYQITASSITAAAVYQAARDMGASYEAAVRQMANLGIVDAGQRDHLLAQTPGQIKADLCHGHRPQGWVDVWPVDMTSTRDHVELISGDELFVSLPENRSTGYRWLSSEELAARAERAPSPAPALFAEPPTPAAERGRDPAAHQGEHRGHGRRARSVAAVNRALAQVPGNAEARRILRAAPLAAAIAPDLSDALGVPAELVPVEDRFEAGWAAIPASATRGVRRAIAGRTDVALPAASRRFAHDPAAPRPASEESLTGEDTDSGTPGAGPVARGAGSVPATDPPVGWGLDPTKIPVAATGQRLLALRSTGEGTFSLDLSYSSAFDPRAAAAARYHLEVTVTAPPQVQNRRRFVQAATMEDAQEPDRGTDADPTAPGDGDAS